MWHPSMLVKKLFERAPQAIDHVRGHRQQFFFVRGGVNGVVTDKFSTLVIDSGESGTFRLGITRRKW